MALNHRCCTSPTPSFSLLLFCIFLTFISICIGNSNGEISTNQKIGRKTEKRKEINLELFTPDQLCLFCRALITRWKSRAEAEAGIEQLKSELLTNCLLLNDAEQAKNCTSDVTDAKLGELRSAENPEQICETNGFCAKGQKQGEAGDGGEKEEEEKQHEMKRKLHPPIPDVGTTPTGSNRQHHPPSEQPSLTTNETTTTTKATTAMMAMEKEQAKKAEGMPPASDGIAAAAYV